MACYYDQYFIPCCGKVTALHCVFTALHECKRDERATLTKKRSSPPQGIPQLGRYREPGPTHNGLPLHYFATFKTGSSELYTLKKPLLYCVVQNFMNATEFYECKKERTLCSNTEGTSHRNGSLNLTDIDIQVQRAASCYDVLNV